MDEEFAAFLSLSVGMNEPATFDLHSKNKRIVRHNSRLRRKIIANTEKTLIELSDGSRETGYVIKWSGDEYKAMVRRIIRGLYCHVFRQPLPSGVKVSGALSLPFSGELLQQWQSWPGMNIGKRGEFRYRYMYSSEDPRTTLWMMMFFDRHFAQGSTGFDDD